MNQRFKLTKSQYHKLVAVCFPDYKGRKVTVEFTDKVHIHDTNWSGGTHSDWIVMRTTDVRPIPEFAPWANPVEGKVANITPEFLIVEHSYFCGKDMGIRIYAHPTYAPKLLGRQV
jgi:hypothetical protein